MKKILDLSLYLVLDPVLCDGLEGLVQTTKKAVENGVSAVQLRADQYKKGQWYAAATALKDLLAPTPVPLFINNEVDVALAVDADGVHIGQNDLPPRVVRQLLGPDKFLGLSASNEQELAAAPLDVLDYFGIGPVYPTTSKTNAPPVLGLDGLKRLVQLKGKPAVAIGGINSARLPGVMQTGIEGIAVVSAICGQADPGALSRELAEIIKKYKNA